MAAKWSTSAPIPICSIRPARTQAAVELVQQRDRLAPVRSSSRARPARAWLARAAPGPPRRPARPSVQRQLAVRRLLTRSLARYRRARSPGRRCAGRQRQVGRQRRVAGQPGQRQAAAASACIGPLRRADLRWPASATRPPAPARPLRQGGRVDVGACPSAAAIASPVTFPVPRPQVPASATPTFGQLWRQPGAHLIRSEQVGHHLESRFSLAREPGAPTCQAGFPGSEPVAPSAVRQVW